MISFFKICFCLLLAAGVPPVAIGLASIVAREPGLGLITGLVGTFLAFTLINRVEHLGKEVEAHTEV